MGDQCAVGRSSGTANDIVPKGCDPSRLSKPEEQMHQEGKTTPAGAGHGFQQAEFLQVMQDVNGRFIANVAKQLRKRAVSLCVEELKEYKRSKKLNILTAAKEVEATGSQPPSASYLIPALPHSDPAACSIEPVHRHDLPSRHTSATEQGEQASAAEAKFDPDPEASVPRQAASLPPLASARQVQPHVSDQPACSKQPESLQPDYGPASVANGLQGSSADQNVGEPMPPPAVAPCANGSLHGPALDSAKPNTCPAQYCTDKQQWSHISKQQGPWSQNRSQQADQWEHAPSQNFMQAKLACNLSFPFGKQPCAVMW